MNLKEQCTKTTQPPNSTATKNPKKKRMQSSMLKVWLKSTRSWGTDFVQGYGRSRTEVKVVYSKDISIGPREGPCLKALASPHCLLTSQTSTCNKRISIQDGLRIRIIGISIFQLYYNSRSSGPDNELSKTFNYYMRKVSTVYNLLTTKVQSTDLRF